LELVRTEAIRLFKQDPELSQPGNLLLAREVARLWQGAVGGAEA